MNLTILISLLFILSIASATEKVTPEEIEIRKEMTERPILPLHGGVATEGTKAILNSESLTQNQKDELMKLHGKMMKETFKIQDQIAMFKGLLFETIVTRPYNEEKVETIKKHLIELNDKRMQNMLTALDEAKKIVKRAPEHEYKDILEPFFYEAPKKNKKNQP